MRRSLQRRDRHAQQEAQGRATSQAVSRGRTKELNTDPACEHFPHVSVPLSGVVAQSPACPRHTRNVAWLLG